MENKKVVVITGASRGIGKAIAQKFLSEGFCVVGISRSRPKCQLSFHIQADIKNEEDRKEIISKVISEFGRIDVLVNNAGVGIYDTWEDMDLGHLREIFEVDFFAPVHLTKLALPYIKKSKGTIINVSSAAGELRVPFESGYTAAKHAFHAFSETLRMEVDNYNINVITVTAGNIKTGFTLSAKGSKHPPLLPFAGKRKELADEIYKAYVKGKKKVIYPSWYKVFIFYSKLFPKGYEKIIMKIWERSFEKREDKINAQKKEHVFSSSSSVVPVKRTDRVE
ncbi:MAG: SDR family NAD(P)-dependent oxidoreductase [Aquificae bacterium]|nr:SDR family NAD(P)-dependent oxidoreductase [Aquificota bacterium]